MEGSMLYSNDRTEDTTNQVDDINENAESKKCKGHMGADRPGSQVPSS